MEEQGFMVFEKWQGTESVVEGFSAKNPALPRRRLQCNMAKVVLG
jgi:hypothetical protein